jgi:hypothetical protein
LTVGLDNRVVGGVEKNVLRDFGWW